MFPIIQRTTPEFWNRGFKWRIGNKKSWDLAEDFPTAVRFWLWHCGVPASLCFRKKRR